MTRVDETWHRLREWTYGQTPSERLAAQVLLHEGYTDLDPSHPLGGKDGGKDALCRRNGMTWVMAVYFPRGQQPVAETRKKFVSDAEGVAKNNGQGFAFVTNQELTLAERSTLKALLPAVPVEIYHLERLATILDKPEMRTTREQYLDIDTRGPSTPPTAGPVEQERHVCATRAVTAALLCRSAMLSGLRLADHAHRAREETWSPRPRSAVPGSFNSFGPAMASWKQEFDAAKAAAEQAVLGLRVHWGAEHSPGIDGLAYLLSYLREWNLKFVENCSRLFKEPFQVRKNFGPCDWDLVFQRDATERGRLQLALDERLAEVEGWAKTFMLTRDR